MTDPATSRPDGAAEAKGLLEITSGTHEIPLQLFLARHEGLNAVIVQLGQEERAVGM